MKKMKLVFERLTNPEVVSYEVLSSPPNTRLQERVFVIDNPTDINPVCVRSNYSKNDNVNSDKYTQLFNLKHSSILVDSKYFLNVYLNGQEFPRELVHINNKTNTLLMYHELKEDDNVTIEYYIDGVEFEFNTQHEDYNYAVRPIVNGQSSLIGKHNILL